MIGPVGLVLPDPLFYLRDVSRHAPRKRPRVNAGPLGPRLEEDRVSLSLAAIRILDQTERIEAMRREARRSGP
jgi:hypothetical protein